MVLDAKIAVITGTVFAGVLVAGALAAPRGNDNSVSDSATVTTAGDAGLLAAAETVYSYDDEDHEDDDDEYYGDDSDHDDDEHEHDHDDDHEEDDD